MHIHTEPARSGSICGSRYCVSVCAAVLVKLAMVISLESSMATARSGLHPSVDIVDRTRKGDRLPLTRSRIDVPRATASSATLPDGCDAAVSSLTRSDLARIAQRCES
jgi:hypothetical protein